MAESFPRDYFEMISIKPISGIGFLRDEGGVNITSRKADAYWAGSMSTGQLLLEEQADWLGFLDRCADFNLRVDWVNPAYVVPRAYTIDNLPFIGSASLVSLTDLRTPVLSGLTSGLELKRGDRLTFEQDGNICHRMVGLDLTVTSTTAQAIQITPRLPIGVFSAPSIVRFKNPKIRLFIIPDSWNPAQVNGPSGLQFEVSEALR